MNREQIVACAALVVLAIAPACHPRAGAGAVRPLRADEAEIAVYLEPFPATPLVLEFDSVAAARREGAPVPLEVKLPVASSETAPRQRLLAVGRLPAGSFTALLVGVRRARVASGDLALPGGPVVTVPIDLVASPGRGEVILVGLRDAAVADRALLDPAALVGRRPERPAPPLLGLCSVQDLESVMVFDRRARGVVGLLPTLPDPREVALDEARQVAYVASAGGNRIHAFDLATFEELAPTRLRVGDRPVSLGLSPDGTTLVVAESGSESLSFVDPLGGQEQQRVAVHGEPVQVVLDRTGLRAFVVLRSEAAVAMVDVAARTVVRTIPVEEQPVRALVSPAGDRLIVAHALAPFLTVYALPAGTPLQRIFAGPGVKALLREPATGLLVVAASDARLQLYDDARLLPVGSVDLPAAATRLAADRAEGTLLALMPTRGSVAVVDVRSRRVRAEIEVGPGPRELAVPGTER